MAGHIGTIWASVAMDSLPFKRGAAEIRRQLYALDATLSHTSKGIGSAFMDTASQMAILAGVVAVTSTKLAADFESALAKAGAVAEASEVQIDSWGKKILEISKETTHSATDIANALYWIKSDMPDATDTVQWETLNIAIKGATAGIADLEDATSALIRAQNAYSGMPSALADAGAYMDAMNTAVQRGSITLQDFVSYMGQAIGEAAQANVPFTELAAAVATLTRKGVPAATAFTALRQTLVTFYKPSAEASKIAEELGIDMSLTGLRAKGLAGALTEIAEKVPDDELARVFSNVRALKAVLPLTSADMKDFNLDLEAMGSMAGATDRMLERVASTTEHKFGQAANVVKSKMIEFGQSFFPLASDIAAAITNIFEGKNTLANTFFNVIRVGADKMEDLMRATMGFKDVLIGLGIAFMAVKGAVAVEGMVKAFGAFTSMSDPRVFTSAASGLQTLVRSFQFAVSDGGRFEGLLTRLGYSSAIAGGGIKGLVAAISPFTAAMAAGVVGGLAVRSVFHGIMQRADGATAAVGRFDRANVDLGMTVQPLVSKYIALRHQIDEMNAAGEDSTEVYAEMAQASEELASLAPELVVGFDDQLNAILGTDEALMQYTNRLLTTANIIMKEAGDIGDLEVLIGNKADLISTRDAWEKHTSVIERGINVLERYDNTGADAALVIRQLADDFDAGREAAEAFIKQAEIAPGDLTNEEAWAVQYIRQALEELDLEYRKHGKTLTELRTAINETERALEQLRQKIIETARAEGIEKDAEGFTEQMLNQLKSNIPEFRQVGLNSIAALAEGMLLNRGVPAEEAGGIAQTIANKLAEGDFSEVAGEWAEEVGSALEALRKKITDEDVDAIKKVNLEVQLKEKPLKKWSPASLGFGEQLKAFVSLEAKTDKFDAGANNVKKTLSALGALTTTTSLDVDASRANQKIRNLKTQIQAVRAEIRALAGVSNSPTRYFTSWKDAGAYAGAGFVEGAETTAGEIKFNASVNGLESWTEAGTTALAGSHIAEDMAYGYQLINQAFSGVKEAMIAKPLHEVNAAVLGLTGGNQALLQTWVGIRNSYTDVTSAFAAIQEQIKRTKREIDELEKSIAAPVNAFENESNKLTLAIMEAEDALNYRLAAQLQLEKDAIDRKKEQLGLVTKIAAYEAADTGGVDWLSMSTAEISAQITKWQEELARKTSEVQTLEIRYDDLQKSVDEFKSVIDDMASYMKTRWSEVESGKVPSYALGTNFVPQTGYALLHKGEAVIPSHRNYPQITQMDMTLEGTPVTMNVMLDSRVVASKVTRIQGRQVSAYARSGGVY